MLCVLSSHTARARHVNSRIVSSCFCMPFLWSGMLGTKLSSQKCDDATRHCTFVIITITSFIILFHHCITKSSRECASFYQCVCVCVDEEPGLSEIHGQRLATRSVGSPQGSPLSYTTLSQTASNPAEAKGPSSSGRELTQAAVKNTVFSDSLVA